MGWPIRTESMVCEQTGLSFDLTVATPTRYEAKPDGQWPVVVVMDGAWLFGSTVDVIRLLSMERTVTDAIVVGISFAETEMAEYLRLRARWFSPSEFVPPEIIVSGVAAEETGRALELADFVEAQVLPWVDEEFRTTADRTLVGHSFSALWGLRVMFDRPLFDAAVLASPSIWWDDSSILQFADTLHAKTLFLTAGETENVAPFNMIDRASALAAELDERDGIRAHFETMLGEGHSSNAMISISRGLRWLHDAR